jgi:AmpD protein
MHIDISSGLLSSARYLASPNCDERPDDKDVSLIVVHSISLPPNRFGGDGIDQLFTNQLDPQEHPYYKEVYEMRVSSHLLIRRDGSLVQYVPFHMRAWHAGESSYRGRDRCNDFSIGIELEGADDIAYETVQYRQLNEVIRLLCQTYPGLSHERIVGHSEISPGRKTDPGPAFDWRLVDEQLA